MLHFRVLGSLELHDAGVHELSLVLRRPKLLALFGYLTIARPRGFHRRDTLLALLWPELDQAHARNALRQSIHALREALGRDILLARGEGELGVDHHHVWCDLHEFDAAVASGRAAHALALYRGELFSGFHLSDVPVFERWLEEERDRVRRSACGAAQVLADSEAKAGHFAAAARWAEALMRLAPYDESALRRLITLLDRSGDRAGAVRAYDEFERRLSDELDLEPSPETSATIDAIRQPRAMDGNALRMAPTIAHHADATTAISHPADADDARAPPSLVPRRRYHRRIAVVVLSAVLALAAAVIASMRSDDEPRLDPDLIAVAPFEVLPPELSRWREGLVHVLSSFLDGPANLRAVPPGIVLQSWNALPDSMAVLTLGARTGARYVLTGVLTAVGPDTLRLTATLLDVASRRELHRQSYRAPASRIDLLSAPLVAGVQRSLGRAAATVDSGGRERVSVDVLGPGAQSICEFLPVGQIGTARLLTGDPDRVYGSFDAFACPDATLDLDVPATAGWQLLIEFPGTSALGRLPWRYFAPAPSSGNDGPVVIPESQPLRGRATFDGKPAAGIRMTVLHRSLGLMANYGASDRHGRWTDFMGRTPFLLQPGVEYLIGPLCKYLGARVVRAPPTHGFLFPTQVRSVDCELVSTSNLRYTHRLTRLVVTPMPGDIGGLSDELAQTAGYGWGVQFPVRPGDAPGRERVDSRLNKAGLVIAVSPERVLSGVTARGHMACGATCRDFGLEATGRFGVSNHLGTAVVWQYSDARSAESVGLHVAQYSFDGRPPADYVLFQFVITNRGRDRLTLHAGVLTDWDIAADWTLDTGGTERDGRLMFQTARGAGHPFLGTLLRGTAPISGTYFFRNVAVPSIDEQLDAIVGHITRPVSDAPGDNRYIHASGPLRLAPGDSTTVWVAIVAGDDRRGFLRNAGIAEADINDRLRRRVDEALASYHDWTDLETGSGAM